MRGFALIILFLLGIGPLLSQHTKGPVKKFTLPERVSVNDYRQGVVFAKIKSAYKTQFQNSSSHGRTSGVTLPGVQTVRPIVSEASARKAASARGPAPAWRGACS